MAGSGAEHGVIPVFFLSDSTGISAETMGNALLIQFPELQFDRTLIPFISSVEQAREVVAQVDEVMRGPVPPLVFTTAAVDEVREELLRTNAPIIDFFGLHMAHVEAQLGARGLREARRLHGVGDVRRYNDRMAAIEFAMEHDAGLGTRGLDRADVVLIAPRAAVRPTPPCTSPCSTACSSRTSRPGVALRSRTRLSSPLRCPTLPIRATWAPRPPRPRVQETGSLAL